MTTLAVGPCCPIASDAGWSIMLDVSVIFVTSLIATALSAMSGGGAGAINIPVMLALGVSFPAASAAQKAAAAFWVLPASYNYLRDKKIEWRFLLIFSAVGLIGVYGGVMSILAISQRNLEITVGVLILILVAYVFFKKEAGLRETPITSSVRHALAYGSALILGFYESFFGSGNGVLFSVVAFQTRGFDFIEALGYYFAIAFAWDVFAVILFASNGYFSWSVVAPMVLGAVIGGYLGSRYAKYKGNKFIKFMFVGVGTILGLKLLTGL